MTVDDEAKKLWSATVAARQGHVPAGWSVYCRDASDGQWVGERSGAHGIDFRLSAATREQLIARIEASDRERQLGGHR